MFAAAMAALFVLLVLTALANGSLATVGEGEASTEYPNGYTHRPLISMFSSLSCPPCMANADPALAQYWAENGYVEGQPVNFIGFHLHAGGAKDDALWNEDGDQWADHQNIIGTPTILVDGGYRDADSSYNGITQAVEEAGNRAGQLGPQGDAFKLTEARVSSVYENGSFRVKGYVKYLEKQGGRLIDMNDNGLNALIKIAMVEDMVDAYSSELATNVTNHNVFRGWAGSESIAMSQEQEWTGEFTWQIPVLDPEEDNVVPIDAMNVHPVLVVYDEDDTSSGGASGWPGATRAINSATPRSTAYDLASSAPLIEKATGSFKNGKATITTTIEDSESIYKAYVAYNYQASDFNGTWKIVEMEISGEGPYTATGEVDAREGSNIYYTIMAYDGDWTEARSEVGYYKAVSTSSSGGGFTLGPGAAALLLIMVLAVVAFYLHSKGKLPIPGFSKPVPTGGEPAAGNDPEQAAEGPEEACEKEESGS